MKRKNKKGKSKKFLPIILLLIFLCALGSGSDDSNENVSDLSTSVTTTIFETDNIDVITTTETTNQTTTKNETTEEVESITLSEDETEETQSITYEAETTTKQTSVLPKNSTFSVKFIDVGQADSALVECDGHYMLIDGGNRGDSNVIYSVLKNSNISHLDKKLSLCSYVQVKACVFM